MVFIGPPGWTRRRPAACCCGRLHKQLPSSSRCRVVYRRSSKARWRPAGLLIRGIDWRVSVSRTACFLLAACSLGRWAARGSAQSARGGAAAAWWSPLRRGGGAEEPPLAAQGLPCAARAGRWQHSSARLSLSLSPSLSLSRGSYPRWGAGRRGRCGRRRQHPPQHKNCWGTAASSPAAHLATLRLRAACTRCRPTRKR